MSDNFNISFGEETIFGADGKSAYQIACEHGFVGTVDEWLTSLKGNTPDITAYATIDGTIGNPGVEVEEAGTIDNPELTFKFSGLKGEKGDTGATPVITAGGSVNQTVGTPSVEISKTGTVENPHFNFAFSGIKGQQGIKGDTGATPNITANATIDATVGTPSVDVSKSGTNENPVLSFAFHNLKGDQGDDGLDGFKNRLTEKTDILPTDCVPINEADGTAKYTTTKNLLADVNDALGRKNWFNPMVNSVTSGLTFNAYDDGVIINGTATSAIYKSAADKELELSKGRYLIKGNAYANDNKFIWLLKFPKNGSWDDRSVVKIIKQDDQELSISESDAEQYYYTPMLTCPKDTTFDNEDWKIILYKLENSEGLDTNLGLNYAVDTLDTTLTKTDKTDMGILGNLIKDQEVRTIENNGITFSVESDGSFTMNGTATAQITQYFDIGVYVQKGDIIVISGAENFKDNFPIQSNDQVFFINLNATTGSVNSWRNCANNLSARTFEITATSLVRVGVRIQADHTYDNFKVYPSIHIIGKKDVETAYTNKELGDRIEDSKYSVGIDNIDNSIIDCNAMMDGGKLHIYSSGSNATNAPSQTTGHFVLAFKNSSSSNFTTQLAISTAGRIFERYGNAGTWSEWKRLVTEDDLAAKKPTYTNILTTNEIIPTTFTSYECADFSQCDAFLVCAMLYGAISATIEVPMVYFQFTGESNSIILKNPKNDIVYRVAKGADNTHIIVKTETEGTTSEYKVRVYGITY